ncbi:photosystem II protein PsbQ [filamentous cyanobacterium LEGE 11480]|uniref:Photosystem II protein PsbQ n=1 Tax=Romeriopsis navalis LEGE 11480 TaxID=2777977 RepID=A0A928Z4W1_9CYAN|nr:photosystem II protein PsbQ [Romeriopsis navalis]MBE9032164.1 photosystem II protein PsbQ [Romeriopsis navalis LEGE 11480]
MSKYRSIVALAMAFVMTLFVAFASPAEARTKAKKAPSYTAEQIESIQSYVTDIDMMRGRLTELGDLIDQEDWIFARNFIHGPLGELRFKMLGIARELSPDASKEARSQISDVFNQLNLIDRAAADKNGQAARKAFNTMNAGIEGFLDFVAPRQ